MPINLILIGTLGFGLGRWSKIEESKTPVLIENPILVGESTAKTATALNTPTTTISNNNASKNFVASKNGTKYHYPWCPSAGSIKEGNKIWFATIEEARAAGYAPASNCPGL